MANLLGDLWANGEPDWAAAARFPDVKIHLYGKTGPRPGRKMGHLTALAEDTDSAVAMVRERAGPALPANPQPGEHAAYRGRRRHRGGRGPTRRRAGRRAAHRDRLRPRRPTPSNPRPRPASSRPRNAPFSIHSSSISPRSIGSTGSPPPPAIPSSRAHPRASGPAR